MIMKKKKKKKKIEENIKFCLSILAYLLYKIIIFI